MRISIERYCVAPRSQRKPQAMIDSSGSDSEMQRFESLPPQPASPGSSGHVWCRRNTRDLKQPLREGQQALKLSRRCSKNCRHDFLETEHAASTQPATEA